MKPISSPSMYGYEATREDGITVQVVRCYQGEWTVFLCRGRDVTACSIEYYRRFGHGNTTYAKARAVAASLLR